ncbi:MAG TPA: hypothetical protein H9717_11680 [Candidatus Eisenbergiella merdipullorum]|uniref:Uncharacterized protein n=1 Tax=Candidatus Eisenbergiella merdipullorum TaxID=2838553 RepID=A0A9D2I901_9FIRM|nr:hypothetical protein [Candidatus Eisenbergiella merdipullorum]
MENYREQGAGNPHGSWDAQEAKRLRNQLVEYDGYLQEMRKANMKNVETLDVVQRYTDKSAAGIATLTEEGAAGMQKLAEESLQGIQQLGRECSSGLRKFSAAGEASLNQVSQEAQEKIRSLSETGLQQMDQVTGESRELIRKLTEEGLAKIQEVNDRNLEAAKRVDEIGKLLEVQTENLREMQKQADDFNHKENVKVYRNVQAVVVEEVKKQTQELKAAEKGTKLLLVFTLAASLVNVALFILQILGILGI